MQPISIRLDPDVREAIQAFAEEDERSLSSYVNRVLRQHVLDKKRQSTPAGKPEKPAKKG